MQSDAKKPAILLVANWDSNVGFAWWLMESYWRAISDQYSKRFNILLAYPSISVLPETISSSDIEPLTLNASPTSRNFITLALFIVKHRIKIIYYSDQKVAHWKYFSFRLLGVKKIIVHDHTPGLRDKATGLKRWAKKLINNSMFSADALFATSDFVKQRFIYTYCANESKCFSVPNGIPLLETMRNRSILQQFDIEDDAVVILGTGRANHYKGIDFALRCIQKMNKLLTNEKIVYLYCGDGPDLQSFVDLSKSLGIDGLVRFPGRVKHIEEICAACDIAFHPSLGEVGYSLSILEYMRAKLPVVVPSNPSVCGATTHEETGLVYEAGKIDDAIKCLMLLVRSPEIRQQQGLNGAKSIREHYSIDLTHRILINSFEAAVEQ